MILNNSLWIFFLYTLIISFLSHRFFIIRAEKYKIKKANTSAERWSSQSKPVLGGITFYAIFLFSIINYIIFFGYENLMQPKILGSILVITIAFLSGLADDMLNTPPSFKFFTQFLCAGVLVFSGVVINAFESVYLNYALTTFWILGMMNSLNMLDNMDAITTSVSSSILIACIVIIVFSGFYNNIFLVLSIGILAALIAFLYYNWHPAKMYMGDNGSQFLGALLSIIGVEVFWNNPALSSYNFVYPMVLVIAIFIVPISDTTTVTINRLLRKQSPFVGGRDHTTHHLSYLGIKDNMVAVILLSVNAVFVAMASCIFLNTENIKTKIIWLGVFAFCTFLILYIITKISKPKKQ